MNDPARHELALAARKQRQRIAHWLILCCAMIFAMVIVGGITRLTESGLSIVDWRPLLGWIPPLNESDWNAVFAQYRTSPQYREINAGMSLESFKAIYWWEFIHRAWGRLIGFVFLIPFLWFLLSKQIDRQLAPWLAGLFLLGAVQGGLGWFMVKSGLVDVPAVSQYRLAAHLALAVIIYAYALWLALRLLEYDRRISWPKQAAVCALLCAWVVFIIVSGAFVAGLDAGLSYNTFPLMDGRIFPELYFVLSPPVSNFFENPAAVQFNHRALAALTVTFIFMFWLFLARTKTTKTAQILANFMLIMVAVQFGLGVATLLFFVPVWLGVLHQMGALILFTLSIWLTFELSRAPILETRA